MNDTLPGLGMLLEHPGVADVFSGRRPWVLALDYDGTLAPFRPERDHAYPYAGIRDVLNRLPTSGHSRFVLITGREASGVHRLLNIQPAPEIWGCHGAQRIAQGKTIIQEPLTARQERGIALARSLVDDPAMVETKSCGVAFHWRGTTEERQESLQAYLEPKLRELADNSSLELLPFDGGLELRPLGISKARAVASLLAEEPDALVFYLGDDRTDEDAFLALRGRGLGVLVSPAPHPSNASFWIKPPQELLILLGRFTSINSKIKRRSNGT